VPHFGARAWQRSRQTYTSRPWHPGAAASNLEEKTPDRMKIQTFICIPAKSLPAATCQNDQSLYWLPGVIDSSEVKELLAVLSGWGEFRKFRKCFQLHD
jgi:hypothetical protein